MKKSLLLFSLLTFLIGNLSWALPTSQPASKKTTKVVSAKALKKEAKLVKKKARFAKKIQRIEKKLAKRGVDNTHASSVWEEDNFKLGALIALGGLLLTILGVLPILGGIFSLIGGLMMIIGVGLMIWVLIEGY